MAEETTPEYPQPPAEPSAALKRLDRLVGKWNLSGETQGNVTFEWMEGGFFLIQHVDFVLNGHAVKCIEIIGQLRPFGQAPSEDIHSRVYDTEGNTLDYVYELEGDTLTIWGGERGSPAYYRGTFSADGSSCAGAWVYPGGGGYETTMTRAE